MRGPTHLVIGLASGTALAYGLHTSPVLAIALAGAGALGALLPDLDSPASLASSRAGVIGWLARLLISHRGVTHGLLLPVAIFIPLIIGSHALQAQILGAILTGYLSHLAADAVTLAGIPVLWPWGHRFHLLPPGLRLRTGGPLEPLVFAAAVLATAVLAGVILGLAPVVLDLWARLT